MIKLLIYLLPLSLYAQKLDVVSKDIATVLNSTFAPNLIPRCGEDSLEDKVVNMYDCHCDASKKEKSKKSMVVVPKSHTLFKKHGIKLVSIESYFSMINDNHIGIVAGIRKGDDKSGNTFGADVGGNLEFKTLNNKNINVGLNYKVRSFTKPFEGKSYISTGMHQIRTWAVDDSGSEVLLNTRTQEGLAEEYGDKETLFNQAEMTMKVLEVNMMITPPKDQKKFTIGYGGRIGYKTLNDAGEQWGAKTQDSFHKLTDMYRFEWETFSNLLTDGLEEYLFIAPEVVINSPELKFGKCTLSNSTHFSMLFNTPIAKNSNQLNIVEPKVSTEFKLGIFGMKKNPEKSIIEINTAYKYDPKNRTPASYDPGYKSSLTAGLKINGRIGKRLDFYVIPLEFYVPLGDRHDNILSGDTMMVKGHKIRAKEMTRDVLGLWGKVGLKFNL